MLRWNLSHLGNVVESSLSNRCEFSFHSCILVMPNFKRSWRSIDFNICLVFVNSRWKLMLQLQRLKKSITLKFDIINLERSCIENKLVELTKPDMKKCWKFITTEWITYHVTWSPLSLSIYRHCLRLYFINPTVGIYVFIIDYVCKKSRWLKMCKYFMYKKTNLIIVKTW